MTVRARCEDCDELQVITSTGIKQHPDRSSTWWRMVQHKNKKSEFCPGSGRLV